MKLAMQMNVNSYLDVFMNDFPFTSYRSNNESFVSESNFHAFSYLFLGILEMEPLSECSLKEDLKGGNETIDGEPTNNRKH